VGEAETTRVAEQEPSIRPTFNRAVRIEARPDRVTADAGVLLMREVMERTGLIDWLEAHLDDSRKAHQVTYSMSELLRTQLALLAQGWTSAAAADRLRADPALRLSVSDRRQDVPLRAPSTPRTPEGLASQPTLSRLLAAAAEPQNVAVLEEASLRCLQQSCRWLDGRRRYPRLTLDVDSLPIEVHGQQAGSAYNGYFGTRCYHPLILGAAEHGHLFGAILRPGNANTAQGAATILRDYLGWIEKHLAWEVIVRGDAGFPADDLLCVLEQRLRPTQYVFRIRNYGPLRQMARPYVERYLQDLRERPEEVRQQPFRAYELQYQGNKWKRARRVVLVIVPPEDGELLPRSFYLITNFSASTMSAAKLLKLYRQRGTYEQQLGDFMSTLAPHLSSTTRPKSHYRGDPPARHRRTTRDAFDTNQAILSLNVLAHNVINMGRRIAERAQTRRGRPKTYGRSSPAMSLHTFREHYLKVPARITLHSRRVWISIEQSTANLWRNWWQHIERLGAVSVVN
jgi:hypothetical protein